MPDGNRNYGLNDEKPKKSRYHLDDRLRNGNRKPGSAIGRRPSESSNGVQRRVKSGSSISSNARRDATPRNAHLSNQPIKDYTITGARVFNSIRPDVNIDIAERAQLLVFRRQREMEERLQETEVVKPKPKTTGGEVAKRENFSRAKSPNKEMKSRKSASKTRPKSPLAKLQDNSLKPPGCNERELDPHDGTDFSKTHKDRRDDFRLESTPTFQVPNSQTSNPFKKRPSFGSSCCMSESGSSFRTITPMSRSSFSSPTDVIINTNTPISAWSDYTAPNNEEMRARLMKGKFSVQFENYYPHVSRKKLRTPPTPTYDDDYDTDLEEEGYDPVAAQRKKERKADGNFPDYKKLCRKLGSIPNSYFLRHALEEDLDLRFRYPNVNDTKTLAKEIKNDATVNKLDMGDNGLCPGQIANLADMLHNNTTITHINLSDNKCGSVGADILRSVLKSQSRLHSLNLAGNQIGDKGAKYIINGLKNNVFLKELNLSHNDISGSGIKVISSFLGDNMTLDVLDLSWNHIRKDGAVKLADAIAMNQQLRVLNVSMNGFHVDGARALGEALEENTTLTDLDLSANRIPLAGARAIAEGLVYNTELRNLKISFNPITKEGAESILNAVENRDNSEGLHVELEGVYVSQRFESRALELMKDDKITINFSLEPSSRGRSRDHISGYVYHFQSLLKTLHINVDDLFSDVTDDIVIVSGSDVIRRVMRKNQIRDPMVAMQLNHFIYTYGDRKLLIRDWLHSLDAQTGFNISGTKIPPLSITPDSRSSSRASNSHWLKRTVQDINAQA